jgi:3-oxoacyl-[acyl-carrier protein] reductase
MIAKPVAGSSVYAATKGAVKTFNQGVAKENAEAGIRINTVNPGGIRTAMTEPLIAAMGEGVPRDQVAMGRWGL